MSNVISLAERTGNPLYKFKVGDTALVYGGCPVLIKRIHPEPRWPYATCVPLSPIPNGPAAGEPWPYGLNQLELT